MVMGVRSAGSARAAGRVLAISIHGSGPFIPELLGRRRDLPGTVVHAFIPRDPCPAVDDEAVWEEGNPGLDDIKSREYLRAEARRVLATPVDHARNEIARYEGYWASVFYAFVAAAGLDVVVEDSGSRGRLDMAVRHGGAVRLFEFKVVEQAPRGAALAQLRARDYAGKHRAAGRPIHLIGVEFSSRERNVVAFDVEPA